MGPETPYAAHVAASSTPTPRVRASRISFPTMSDSSSGRRRRTARTACLDPTEPAGGDVLLEATDTVEHVVHPAAGGLLHDGLELLALAERVEHRRDRAELEG